MERKINIKCLNNDKSLTLSRGKTLFEIAEKFDVKLNHPVLGALVNNQLRDMSYETFHSKTIKFIDITHPDGMRMYIRSLSFLLLAAVNELYPEAKLRIEHSVSKGIYCEIDNIDKEASVELAAEISEKMRELVAQKIPIEQDSLETSEVVDIFKGVGFNAKADLIRHRGNYYSSFYRLNEHVGLFYGLMVPNTSYLEVFDFNKYYNGFLLRLPKVANPTEVEDLLLQPQLFDIFREFSEWGRVLRVTKISELNKLIESNNRTPDTLIKVTEALQEKKIAQIADRIASKKEDIQMVLISGPSSSGKTTFSKRLSIQMLVLGIYPLTISLDNYFVNRKDTPLDEDGEYDFETIEALDLKLFNEHLKALLNGEEIEVPKFSFETGERFYDGEKMKMGPDNILIIEGIHGLNPLLTEAIDDKHKFKVYVSALTSLNIDSHTRIPTTDNRLIRRIIRDYKYRKYSAQDTISRWASVRRGEEKHIFPFQENADVMFNTALLYELPILKPFIEPILLEVQPNQEEYVEASRLLMFFSYVKPFELNSVPPTSILREFLGGSSFSY